MYRGRYQQGDIISFRFPFTNASDVAALPLEQVRWKIIDPTGATTYLDYAPLGDTDILGSFAVKLRITTFFATPGRYTIWVQAKMSSTLYRTYFMCFRIISGGVNGGGVHSQYYWNRPEASYIVWSNENGEIISGRNPTLS
jgi:hypothetical protein